MSSKVWKVANNCLRQCLLSPFFSLGPFSLSPHGYLYLRHLAVIDPDVPTRLRKEILAPLSLIFLFMRIHCTLEEMFSFSSLSERDTGWENLINIDDTRQDSSCNGKKWHKKLSTSHIYSSNKYDSRTAYRIFNEHVRQVNIWEATNFKYHSVDTNSRIIPLIAYLKDESSLTDDVRWKGIGVFWRLWPLVTQKYDWLRNRSRRFSTTEDSHQSVLR